MSKQFWSQVEEAGLLALLNDRLAELEEALQSEEVNAIWWDRLGLMLDEGERWTALRITPHARTADGRVEIMTAEIRVWRIQSDDHLHPVKVPS